jgi:gliding motility-associated-like protein
MSNRYQKIKFCLYAFFAFAPFMVKAQINVSVATKAPTCNGYTNGEATATVTGGKEPYSYSWSNGQGGQTFYAAAGNYKLTVTDADGKTAIKDVAITEPAILVANATAMNGACSDDKSLMASATGGTAPFSFSWRNLTSGATTTAAMLANPAQGGYFLQVTDSKGCATNKFMNVDGALVASLNITNVYCNGRGDGGIEARVSGGTGPYSFKWSANANSSTTALASSLSGGIYTVSVTDANGCTKTLSGTVIEPPVLKANPVITGQCSGLGSVVLNPSGGIPPYKAMWTHGPTSMTLTNLPPGAYYVCVMDANGCPADTPIKISNTASIGLVLSKEDAACSGVNDGQVVAHVTGGATGPYTFNWSNGGALTSSTISGLTSGTYTVTLVDGAGCTETKSITLTNKTSLSLTTTAANSLCGGTTGTASAVTVTGGTAPFTYKWSNNATTKDVTNLAAGNYTVTVSDIKGCQATQSVTVGTSGSNISATALVTDGKCNTTNGEVKLTATGGKAPYTYKYSGGTNQTGTFTNLPAGDYTFSITDANGCSFTQSSSVKNVGAVKAAFNQAVNTSVACNADNLLYKFTNSSTGSIAGATYKWTFTGNRTSTETSPEITFGTLAGEAELTITSAEGCTDVIKKSFDVDLIRLDLQDALSGCVGTSLKPTATNANTKFTHTYSWTPLSIIESGANTATPTFKSNTAGNTKAFVTITNSLGCTKTDSVTVSSIAKAALSPSDISFKQDCQSRKIDFKNSSALADKYRWVFGDPTNPTAGSTLTTPTYTYAQSGDVTVTLVPSLGCYDTLSVKLPVNTPLSLTKGTDKAICDATAQTLTATSNGPANKIEWSTNRNFSPIAGTGASFNGAQTGAKTTYYVRASDAAGTCTTPIDSVVITNNEIKATVASPASLGLCAGVDNKQITVNNPNNDGLKVVWTPAGVIKGSNTALNPTINVSAPSTGTITGTFENQFGCKTTKTVPYAATSVNLNAGADQSVCTPAAQTLTAVSNGTKIEWSLNSNFTPVAGTGSTFNVTPTNTTNTYYVRSSDANCVVVDTVTISNNELKVSVTTPNLSLCVGTGKQATVNAPAGTTVVWTPANVIDGSNTALNPILKAGAPASGKITGEFTNAAGCKTTQEIAYTATEVKATVTASDKLVYKDFDVTLNAQPAGTGYTYKWTPLPTATTAQVKTQPATKTTYTVIVTDANGCSSTASVEVDVLTPECSEPYVYVPTAFSPNNDGRNDKIRVHGEFLTSCEFVIYNRWGEKVFETKVFENGVSEGWDGVHANKGVCPDVYGFYVRGTCRDNTTFFKKGNITVLK